MSDTTPVRPSTFAEMLDGAADFLDAYQSAAPHLSEGRTVQQDLRALAETMRNNPDLDSKIYEESFGPPPENNSMVIPPGGFKGEAVFVSQEPQ